MHLVYSKVCEDKLLHLINRFDEITERTNVAPENEFLQLATLRMEAGKTFRPHKHIWKAVPGTDEVIAQESWVVIQGSVRVYMYDVDDQFLESQVLMRGDCSMTFEGGHTYEILEDDTVVYEYKTGPYQGIEFDKVFIDDHR
jgi:cupin fold WbuC family metalloprotein